MLVTEVMPDVYVNAVLHALRGRPDVTDVILGLDGRWRVSEQEPWQDIRLAPPEALQLPPQPTSDTPAPAAPTAVVDAPPPLKPSPEAVTRASAGAGGAIEIISSSDDDEPQPRARGSGPPAAGPSGVILPQMPILHAAPPGAPPPAKRARQVDAGAIAAPRAAMPLAPPLGQVPPMPMVHLRAPRPQLHGVPGGVPGVGAVPGNATAAQVQQGQHIAHSHNNGYAFR